MPPPMNCAVFPSMRLLATFRVPSLRTPAPRSATPPVTRAKTRPNSVPDATAMLPPLPVENPPRIVIEASVAFALPPVAKTRSLPLPSTVVLLAPTPDTTVSLR